jgi:hypothetical protein
VRVFLAIARVFFGVGGALRENERERKRESGKDNTTVFPSSPHLHTDGPATRLATERVVRVRGEARRGSVRVCVMSVRARECNGWKKWSF